MGAIRVIQKPENGLLIIPVPDNMREETMVIDFRPAREHGQKALAEVSNDFFGKLKRPKADINLDELSVYDQ